MSQQQKPTLATAPQPALPDSPQPAWPNAQDNVGAAGIVPVVVRTVREMVEPQPETAAVFENELSDIDLAARPVAARTETRIDVTTDGRASLDEEPRSNRFAAHVENVNSPGGIAWLESALLVLAGAIAAVTAMRVFAA